MSNEKKVLMKIEHLTKEFEIKSKKLGGKPQILHALNDVSVDIYEGETLGVIGESGCGKSTLAKAVMRLVNVKSGEIKFEDENILNFKNREDLKHFYQRVQMIFQNPYSSFNPKQKIGSALREVGKVYKMSDEEINQKIKELLEYIRLPEDMLLRSPGELSGGQLQRLAIARALILKPSFIVADEPVSALDVSVQAQILNLIVDLRKEMKMTMMFISHEMSVVEHICDRVAVMYLGQIV